MNILFLSDNFPPEVNAAATRVYERACYWVKWGHHVTVITSAPNFPKGKLYSGYKNKWYQVEMMDGIRVVRVKTFMTSNSGTFLRILDFLSYMFMAFIVGLWQKRPQIIVATSPQFFCAIAGWGLSAIRRIPFVFELSDLWPASIMAVGAIRQKKILQWLSKIEFFLYRRAVAIVVLSPAFKKYLVKRGIAENKIYEILNGVDNKRYQPKARDRIFTEKYKLQDSFVVGYVGTHGMAHNLMNVLNAASLLLQSDDKEHQNIRFLFVGDGAERKKLIATAKKNALKNCLFIPSQPKASMPDYWSLCDIALVHLKNNPVFSTVIPSKIFEAMGMGLPILLAAPKGEASNLIALEAVGESVMPNDPAALKKAILKIKQSSTLSRQYAKNSLKASKRYSREKQAELMLKVLKVAEQK